MSIPDAILAIAKNSARYIQEADEHFKMQRYASAFSAAVLSIEETGKIVFLKVTGKSVNLRHFIKQVPFAMLLQLPATLLESMLWKGLTPNTALTKEQQDMVTSYPEFAEFVTKIRAGELQDSHDRTDAMVKAYQAKFQRDGMRADIKQLLGGSLHKLRLKATYVDIGENCEILSEPSSITSDSAEAVCIGAWLFLVIVSSLCLPARSADIENAIPKELTGIRLLAPIKQMLQHLSEGGQLAEGKQQWEEWIKLFTSSPKLMEEA